MEELLALKPVQIGILFSVWAAGNYFLIWLFKLLLRRRNGIYMSFTASIVRLSWAIMMAIIITSQIPATQAFSRTLLTSSGLLVAVAGFAAQQVLADIVSGIMISWAKPFEIGEKITISDLGISGIVESITIRHTVIRTYHNSRMIVPNSIINKSVVENSNYDNHYIGNYLEIPISYDSNLERAIGIMGDVIAKNELVLDMREDKTVGKKVPVYVKDLSENGVILKSTICTKNLDDNFNACSEIRRELKKQFDVAGIRIHCSRMQLLDP